MIYLLWFLGSHPHSFRNYYCLFLIIFKIRSIRDKLFFHNSENKTEIKHIFWQKWFCRLHWETLFSPIVSRNYFLSWNNWKFLDIWSEQGFLFTYISLIISFIYNRFLLGRYVEILFYLIVEEKYIENKIILIILDPHLMCSWQARCEVFPHNR